MGTFRRSWRVYVWKFQRYRLFIGWNLVVNTDIFLAQVLVATVA